MVCFPFPGASEADMVYFIVVLVGLLAWVLGLAGGFRFCIRFIEAREKFHYQSVKDRHWCLLVALNDAKRKAGL